MVVAVFGALGALVPYFSISYRHWELISCNLCNVIIVSLFIFYYWSRSGSCYFCCVWLLSMFYEVFALSLKKTSDTAAHPCNATAFCCPGDGGVASSIPSQSTLASSSSLDIFDPLPAAAPASTNPTRKTPESFLGPNAALVNLDSLVTKPAQPAPAVNPFLASTGEGEEEKTCLGLHWIP